MRVFVIGGTGSIGTAVVNALIARKHDVVALARSAAAASHLKVAGARPVTGDMRDPTTWISAVDDVDAVVQTASDFTTDSGAITRRLFNALLPRLAGSGAGRTLLFTGGCWLYGATGDHVATEDSPLRAPPAWAWAIEHIETVLAATSYRGIVIHPAMVYERDGGVLTRFCRDLVTIGRVRVVGNENVRWPLVHRRDIGMLYALALERGMRGVAYNGAAVESVAVADLARAMARRAGVTIAPLIQSADELATELGEWARGYAIDQRMSGARARRDLGWMPVHTDPVADVS